MGSRRQTGKLETYVPYTDSVTTRVFGAFPWLIRRVEPAFATIGEHGRRRFLAERAVPGTVTVSCHR